METSFNKSETEAFASTHRAFILSARPVCFSFVSEQTGVNSGKQGVELRMALRAMFKWPGIGHIVVVSLIGNQEVRALIPGLFLEIISSSRAIKRSSLQATGYYKGRDMRRNGI